MKRKNQGKMMHSIMAITLALLLAAKVVFPGNLWEADAVYAADDDTESDSGSTVSESENVKVGEFGTTVGEVEDLDYDFILTYTFYDKSNGSDAWENFVVEIRNESYYWFDVRADNYGWLYFPTSGYVAGDTGITFGDGASDWDVWTSLMQQGQNCTVYVIRQGSTVTVISQSAGDTFYAIATIDSFADDCPLIVHLTGESCILEDVTYSIEKVTDWDSKTEWMNELMALAAENNEGGATIGGGATLEGTELESTEWWSGVTGVELSSDSAYTTWNYTILVESSVSDFGVEVYNEDLTKYITTLTNGDAWYAGDDMEANDLVIAGDSVSDSLERGKFFYVTVVRTGDDFTIYYMDSSGDILLMFFATDTNMDETAYVHFYAEYGSFVVAADMDTDTAIESDDSEYSEDTETEDSEDTETDDTEDEDTEYVEENPDDDDDDDDDYDIEDLDEEDTEDTETEEEETYIIVTLDEASYTSSTWWSGAYGSEASWTGDAVWVYSVTVDETYGDDAFSVEIYDEDGNTITLSSDGTSQYDGVTGDPIEVTGDPIVLEAGAEYVVSVHREGADLWALFYDEDGNELLSFYAGNTDLADTVAGHFYAQIGAYTVNAESSGTEAAGVTALALAALSSDGSDGTDGSNASQSSNESGSSQQGGSSRASVSTPATGDVSVWSILLIVLLGMGCVSGAYFVRRRRG